MAPLEPLSHGPDCPYSVEARSSTPAMALERVATPATPVCTLVSKSANFMLRSFSSAGSLVEIGQSNRNARKTRKKYQDAAEGSTRPDRPLTRGRLLRFCALEISPASSAPQDRGPHLSLLSQRLLRGPPPLQKLPHAVSALRKETPAPSAG